MTLTLIAAISENNVIGKEGKIPWRISEDMVRFRGLTKGHPVIMGRKTYLSLPDKFRPLPKRPNIVLSRKGFEDDKMDHRVKVVRSLDEALECIGEGKPQMEDIDYNDAFIIGGGTVYREALPLAQKLEITHVHQIVEGGDAFFPEIDFSVWREDARDDRNGYSFVTYHRFI